MVVALVVAVVVLVAVVVILAVVVAIVIVQVVIVVAVAAEAASAVYCHTVVVIISCFVFQLTAHFQQSLEQGSRACIAEVYQTAIVHYRTALMLLAKHSDLQVWQVCTNEN